MIRRSKFFKKLNPRPNVNLLSDQNTLIITKYFSTISGIIFIRKTGGIDDED